jgi:glycerophosphoryl diester phosphodiesterase
MTEDPGRVIAHRGASRIAPENTLAAFRAAAAQGARWIEFDVSPLGDGTPVVFHDCTLDRCTDATGPLAAIGRADLARIHAGARHGPDFASEPLPTLEAVLELLGELELYANLEIKAHRDRPGRRVGDLAGPVAEALARRPWASARIVVSSFDEDELAAFRELASAMPVALLVEEPPTDWQARLTRLRAEALHLGFRHLRQDVLSEARSSGFRVRVYTINEPALMEPFRAHGLTGVITDHPPLFLDDPAWAAWAQR